MESVLKVDSLKKEYPFFKLNGVSFVIKKNTITGLIGTNGAGKTTTIKAVLGLIKSDSGSVEFFGKPINSNQVEIKNRIGIVFDDGYFYEDLKISEMKKIVASSYYSWSDSEFDKYMKKFNLDSRQKISTLSKGMKMKFSLALALSHNAELLIMDEPTSGLDPMIRKELINILEEYVKEDGRSVIFSTHITSDLEKVADRLILIDKGIVVFDEDKDILIESHEVIKGDVRLLGNDSENLFLCMDKNDDNFIGITNKKSEVIKNIQDIEIQKPSIEDIMLAYVRG